MLVGVVAFNVLKVMDMADPRALGVLYAGYFFQGNVDVIYHSELLLMIVPGIGLFMSFFYLCIFVIRYAIWCILLLSIILSSPLES